MNIDRDMAFRFFAIRNINVKKEKTRKNRKKGHKDSNVRPNMHTTMILRLM